MALRERTSWSSSYFDQFGQCSWKLRRIQPTEGPAWARAEHQWAALRERTSWSSSYFDQFGQCSWKLRRIQPTEGPARARAEHQWAALRERTSWSSSYSVQPRPCLSRYGRLFPGKGVCGACFEHLCAAPPSICKSCRNSFAWPGAASIPGRRCWGLRTESCVCLLSISMQLPKSYFFCLRQAI